jgi:histone H3/H4
VNVGGRPRKLQGLEDEIVAAYMAGTTMLELCARYECGRTPVRRILHEAGATRPPNRPRSTDAATEASVVAAYTGSMWQVARDHGLTVPVVERILRQHGVTIDRRMGRRPKVSR